jgi:hypothetical protein
MKSKLDACRRRMERLVRRWLFVELGSTETANQHRQYILLRKAK